MAKEIRKFGDIKLKDYSKQPYCENSQSYTGKYKDKLFSDYANNLKKMVQSVNENQTKLLDIINDLFVYVDDPITKQKYTGSFYNIKSARVNPLFWEYDFSASNDPTGSYLAPYITTIGLYDNEMKMIAVAKLPQPIKSLPDYPLNFIIRFDT